jgi:hypothetical protein
VGGRGQGRQPPEAVARSASLEAGRTQVYENTVAPRRRIPFASVIGELTVLRARSGSQRLRRFDASHGRQDPSAQRALPRPPHSLPNVRDDRDTPLLAGWERAEF